MTRIVEGRSDASGLHIGVAVATWNQAITDRLLDGAQRALRALNTRAVTVLRVPGALELPLAAQALLDGGADGVVAIGVVIKGDTDHYDVVVRESCAGITRVALDRSAPVGNAILAVHDPAHALERAGADDSNKGVEVARAVVAMVNAVRDLA